MKAKPKARDVRVTVYTDDDGDPLTMEVVLPKQTRTTGDTRLGVPDKTEEVLPFFSVDPKSTHTTVTFDLGDADVFVKRKRYDFGDGGVLAYWDKDFLAFDAFMEAVDAEDPASDPKNWMPVWILPGEPDGMKNGFIHLTIADRKAWDAYMNSTQGYDSMPKLYEYRQDKPYVSGVVPLTMHPSREWLINDLTTQWLVLLKKDIGDLSGASTTHIFCVWRNVVDINRQNKENEERDRMCHNDLAASQEAAGRERDRAEEEEANRSLAFGPRPDDGGDHQ